jgi:hypothetical protein
MKRRKLHRRYGRAAGAVYDVFRLSNYTPKRRLESGPHSWPVAWRKAAALNKAARKAFAEGRSMYEVPEYVVEKRES